MTTTTTTTKKKKMKFPKFEIGTKMNTLKNIAREQVGQSL